MKKFLLILLSLFSFYNILVAQKIKVLERSTLIPIEDVAIYGKNYPNPILTNAKGEVDISSFVDSDTLSLTHIGYYPKVVTRNDLLNSNTILLSDKSYDLEDVVVSASRFEEKIKDVPQQVQVLHGKDIQFMNQQTTPDVLTQSGNVLVQKSQMGGGSPIIRGFEANKVLLVVDGVRMNNAIYRAGHLQNALTIDNSLLDKTEIVFGPGSVVYGSDALGGVIHFYTKKPLLADSGKFRLGAGAYARYSSANSEKTGHINLNFGFRKIGFLSSFTTSEFGDLQTGSNRNPFYGNWGKATRYVERINNKDSILRNENVDLQRQTGYKQYDFMQKVLFQQSKRTSHLLNFQYSTSSNISRYDRLTQDVKGVPEFADWYYGPQKRLFGSYTLELDLGKVAEKARLILAYQDIEESRHSRALNNQRFGRRFENVKVYTGNLDLFKKLGRNELRYGAEFTHNNVVSKANRENIRTGEITPLDTRYPSGGSTMSTLAGYITHSWEITPKWILNDGLRYSYITLNSNFSDKSFYPFPYDNVEQRNSALNGNLGIVFLPSSNLKFSLLGSTGFRAPNVDDIGKFFEQTSSVDARVMVPNPSLKPEYTYNAELGITKGFGGNTWLELIGFYTLYRDAITTVPGTFVGQSNILYENKLSQVIILQNTGKAYIYGGSANLQSDLNEFVSLTGSINYTYGRINTDSTEYPLDHIPPIFGRVSALLKLKKLRGEFYTMFNGWKRMSEYNLQGEDNERYATIYGTPAWFTLNIRASYHFNSVVQLQASVENILDQHYRVFASGISAPGRNLVATLRLNY